MFDIKINWQKPIENILLQNCMYVSMCKNSFAKYMDKNPKFFPFIFWYKKFLFLFILLTKYEKTNLFYYTIIISRNMWSHKL